MTVHFTVDERQEKQVLNTPGAPEVLKGIGGPSGLPFFAFLDAQGTLIVNSIRIGENGKRGGNIGHPIQPEEVDWFMAMLAKAAPRMTTDERAAIEKPLRAQKK